MHIQVITGMEWQKNALECSSGSHRKKSLRMNDLHVEKQICLSKKEEAQRRISDGHDIQTHPVNRQSALYQGSYMKTEG